MAQAVGQMNNNIRPLNHTAARFPAEQATHAQIVHRRRRRVFYCIMVGAIVASVMAVLFQYQQLREASANSQYQQEQLAKSKKVNKDLNQQRKNLKDDAYVEKLIRSRYMYTKEGEVVFNLPDGNTED
ncbi:MAG: septum formation initiator family protein [Lactobacillaceae bacterium]|jgi:cell division protein DivIC|nr:septum formation initiator family protein [Lactobacillaceae bacterium]